MADQSERLNVKGLKDFQRELRKLGDDYPKALQRANKAAAGRMVEGARARYPDFFTPRTGRTQRSIRATATQNRIQIRFGGEGERLKHALGQEFGSKQYPQFGGEGTFEVNTERLIHRKRARERRSGRNRALGPTSRVFSGRGQFTGFQDAPIFRLKNRGRFVYPAIRAGRNRLAAQYLDTLGDLARKAFPEISTQFEQSGSEFMTRPVARDNPLR